MSFSLTIPLNLEKLVKTYRGIIVRQHHIVRKLMGLQRERERETERYAEKKGGNLCCTIAVWIGRKMVGGFHGMLLLSAKHVRTLYESRFGEPFKGPIIPFGSLVEYHPISVKDLSRLHQFGKKVLPGILLGYVLYAGGIWKGDIMVADIEELEKMDASEIHARRLNANEVITHKIGEQCVFPVADGIESFLEEIRF